LSDQTKCLLTEADRDKDWYTSVTDLPTAIPPPLHPGTAKESGETKTILFGLCGHGHFDLSAYDSYLSGSLEDYEHPQAEVDAALAELPSDG
jgi:predicted alternative tryptophan synthase beta-subunit